jgi:anaerobic dimethyl sulfoxide reductase subunit C (anchor subunit)
MLKEWPLVAFTVAGQMAVGVFLFAGLPFFLIAAGHMDAVARRTGLGALAAAFALLAAAALVSLFHLHHPFRARYVLSNLRTSWLSREIFFELGFMGLVALAIVLALTGAPQGGLFKGVMAAAGLAGVLFLLSMTKLYMLQTVPAWNLAYTPLSFVMTALTLGAMAAALLIDVRARERFPFGDVLTLSFFLVAAEIVLSLLFATGHGICRPRTGPSLRPPAETPRLLHLGRLALLTAGLVLIGAAMSAGDGRAASGSGVGGVLAVAFVLILAGQVAGRFLFYGLIARTGR